MKKAPAIVLLILGSVHAAAVVYACIEELRAKIGKEKT